MKRLSISIHSEKHPELVYLAYALAHEITDAGINFFSTVKFRQDEELEIRVDQDGEVTRYHVVMGHLHEQISSGRIMNAIPDAEHPFPARTFYRCFTKLLSKEAVTAPTETATPSVETETTAEAVAPEVASSEPQAA